MSFIHICLVTIVYFIGSSREQTCNQAGFKRFNGLLEEVSTAAHPRVTFPENSGQLANWCKNLHNTLEDVDKFNKKCNKGVLKQSVGFYIYGSKRTLKLYCKSGSKPAKGLLESASCYNKNKKDAAICVNQFSDVAMGIENEPDDKRKIPLFCCAYNKFMSCFEERMINSPSCNEKKLDEMEKYMRSQSSDAIKFFCGDYQPDSDKCERLGEPPKKNKLQKRGSPLIHMAKIFESFDEV